MSSLESPRRQNAKVWRQPFADTVHRKHNRSVMLDPILIISRDEDRVTGDGLVIARRPKS
jgi:hypothetical protein